MQYLSVSSINAENLYELYLQYLSVSSINAVNL